MKKLILALAATICCIMALMAVKSCTVELVGPTTYYYGFEQFSTSSGVMEMSTIENAFTDAFHSELGVTTKDASFEYEGGDAKVKKACESAAAKLNAKAFEGKYTFTVKRVSVDGYVSVYIWQN